MRFDDVDSVFSFERLIASTSKSNVWLANPRSTCPSGVPSHVVIKELFLSRIVNPDHVVNERNVLEYLGKLDFPRSSKLIGTSKNGESLFLIQTLVQGAPLHLHIPRTGLDLSRARRYFAETLSILEFLHAKKILYRDLKLSNLVLSHGRIFIVDFGHAVILSADNNERRRSICGTPHAMAPEVERGDEYGFACDFWSLGILLRELLTGQTEPIPLNNPKITPEAAELISRLLEEDPGKRLVSFETIRSHQFFAHCPTEWWRSRNWDSTEEEPSCEDDVSVGHRFIFGRNDNDVFKDF